MPCEFSAIVFDLAKVEKQPMEVCQGLPVFWVTAMSYLVLPAPPMVTRLSPMSPLQLWRCYVFFQEPTVFHVNVMSPIYS